MRIKNLLLIIGCVVSFVFSNCTYAKGRCHYRSKTASTYNQSSVSGYHRSNGTYVKGHYRSKRDGNPYNNWSTIGNTNPHTGASGTHYPYKSYKKSYKKK